MVYMLPHLVMQNLMMRKELAKDPALATESWARFLPTFRKYGPSFFLFTTTESGDFLSNSSIYFKI